jgi:CO/xanthine dehydrogenase Mo-binding subunit
LGVKGAGEAGCIPVGPLFAQALENALAGSNLEILEMPLSPNRLWELVVQADDNQKKSSRIKE